MAVWMTLLSLLLLIQVLEEENEPILQDLYNDIEVANPLIMFIMDTLFVTLLVNGFLLCLFTCINFSRNEDIDTSRHNGPNEPALPPALINYDSGEESDTNNFFLDEHSIRDQKIVDLENLEHDCAKADKPVHTMGLKSKVPEYLAYESTKKYAEISKQKRRLVHHGKQRRKIHKTVLVPIRHKINLLVILRRKYRFKKTVPTYSILRYTSLNEILLAGHCVEINEFYVSVTNVEECSTSARKYEELDFESAVKTVYTTARSGRELLNAPDKKKNMEKSNVEEN